MSVCTSKAGCKSSTQLHFQGRGEQHCARCPVPGARGGSSYPAHLTELGGGLLLQGAEAETRNKLLAVRGGQFAVNKPFSAGSLFFGP